MAPSLGTGILCGNSTMRGQGRWRCRRSGRRCGARRICGCCAAAAAMSTTPANRETRAAMCCARRTRMRAIRAVDAARARAAPGVLAVLTGEDLRRRGLGTLTPGVPAPAQQRRAGLCLPAAVARPGTGALCRRPGRVRRRRHAERGERRRRADRDRLRAVARRGHRGGGARPRRAGGLGRKSGQRGLFPRGRRQGGGRCGLCAAPTASSATKSISTASPQIRWSRAAASPNTTPTRTAIRSAARSSRCTQPAPRSPTASSNCRSTSSGWSATIWAAVLA